MKSVWLGLLAICLLSATASAKAGKSPPRRRIAPWPSHLHGKTGLESSPV